MRGNRRLTGTRVRGAQRMIAAFGTGNDGVGFSGKGEQTLEQAGGDERHVAGDDDHRVVPRGGERRIEPAKRSAVRARDRNHDPERRRHRPPDPARRRSA